MNNEDGLLSKYSSKFNILTDESRYALTFTNLLKIPLKLIRRAQRGTVIFLPYNFPASSKTMLNHY